MAGQLENRSGDNGGMVRPVLTVTSNLTVHLGLTDVLSVVGMNTVMMVLENLVVKMMADIGELGKYLNVIANLHVLLVLTADLKLKGRNEGMLVPVSSFTSLGGVVALLFYREIGR